MNLRKIVEQNLFINDWSRAITCASYNSQIVDFTKRISEIDSIKEYDEFKHFLRNIPGRVLGSTYTVKRAYAENTLYGYADGLLKYGGLTKENPLYLPLLEHGIDLSEEFYAPRYAKNRSYIFQGSNKIEKWEKAMGRKAYSVGPFIHYAQDYYTDEEIASIHMKNGRTLLVFPPHSDEYGGGDFFVDSFTKEMFKIAEDYDTIIACIFWIDVTDRYSDYLRSQGVKLVSSGFKLDRQFVSRMKSIIKMSDTVLFPILTTSIGYAYYLDRKVICLSSERNENSDNIEDQEFVSAENNRYIDKFCRLFTKEAQAKSEKADCLIDFYWGVSNIKTKEEIRDIFNNSKNDIIRHLGF